MERVPISFKRQYVKVDMLVSRKSVTKPLQFHYYCDKIMLFTLHLGLHDTLSI